MIKVFLILASAVLLGSAALGIMNRSEFIEVRTLKDENNKTTKSKENKTDEEIEALRAQFIEVDSVHGLFDEAELGTERYNDNIEGQNRVLAASKSKQSTLMAEKAEYDQAIEQLALRFEGIDLDTLPQTIEKMKGDVADAEKKQEELNLAVAAMAKRVERNESTIGTYTSKQAERSQGIALNGTEGTITAVNQDWGFAVVNIGKNQGVDGDSELIVKRDGDIVGKLSIVSIEPRLTVADIRLDTLKEGARILPGDKVIFEKLQN